MHPQKGDHVHWAKLLQPVLVERDDLISEGRPLWQCAEQPMDARTYEESELGVPAQTHLGSCPSPGTIGEAGCDTATEWARGVQRAGSGTSQAYAVASVTTSVSTTSTSIAGRWGSR